MGPDAEDYGEARIVIRRDRRRPRVLAIWYFGGAVLWYALYMIGNALGAWRLGLSSGIGATALYVFFLYRYIVRNTVPAARFELGPEDAALFQGDELVQEMAFDGEVFVDAFINPSVRSEEYGPLNGLTFQKGDVRLDIHPRDGWSLWDVQRLLWPVMRVIDRHRMGFGRDLKELLELLAERDARRHSLPADGDERGLPRRVPRGRQAH